MEPELFKWSVFFAIVGLVHSGPTGIEGQKNGSHVIDERSLLVECLTHSKVCYGDLGCFRTDGDWVDLLKRPCSVIPESPKSINTQFILYKRSKTPVSVKYNDDQSVKDSGFDHSKPSKFIVHGFLDDGTKQWIKIMAKELLVNGDYNVFVVDWGDGSGIPYFQATANTRVVGALIARFTKYLKEKFSLKYKDCHYIGHSLGAHVVGYAGASLKEIDRISGLDPAEPYFDGMAKKVRLDDTDAKFVDVMHTDDSSIIGIGYGTKQRSGHVDFFPNNGDNQPGCGVTGKVITYILKGFKEGIRKTFACDHLRVVELFSDSINSKCPFAGFRCSSWKDFLAGKCSDCGSDGSGCALMGFSADMYRKFKTLPASGPFYLKTAGSLPFCVYNYKVTVQLNNHPKSEKQQGYLYLTITGDTGKIKKFKLNEKLEKMEHTESYSYYFTNAINVGIIKSVEFEWDYQRTLLDPSTWEIKKKIFGRGIKLYVKHVKVNQMDVIDPDIKKLDYPSIFCGDRNKPIEENTPVDFYNHDYCT